MQQQGADQSAFSLGNGAYGKQCLSSFSVISVKVGASCTPRCASSMIFKATTRVAGSSINFIPNFQHMVSRASDICRITSGWNAWPERNSDLPCGRKNQKSAVPIIHREVRVLF